MIIQRTIYAGDTPLESTIVVEQTGPMQLTVRAGHFTTTGQARIVPLSPQVEELIAAGKAERLPDGLRALVWLVDRDGSPIELSQTYVLESDQVLDLVSHPSYDKFYRVELVFNGISVDMLAMSRIDAYPMPPTGWREVHDLVFEFGVPAGATSLSDIEIPVLTVLPGFPPGTGPEDWLVQTGTGVV